MPWPGQTMACQMPLKHMHRHLDMHVVFFLKLAMPNTRACGIKCEIDDKQRDLEALWMDSSHCKD